jgi:Skp family chaperone for outer membrane proteins
MRSKSIMLAVATGVVLSVCFGYQRGLAKAKKDFTPPKVGVVSIRGVLENTKKKTQFEAQLKVEGEKVMAELDKSEKEIEALKADMNTRVAGSGDYMDLMHKGMKKQAALKATDEFYQKQFALKQQVWTEETYKEILAAAEETAKNMGLDMVLAKEDFLFPSASSNELLMTIKTSKVLYSSDELDITKEVLATLDK